MINNGTGSNINLRNLWIFFFLRIPNPLLFQLFDKETNQNSDLDMERKFYIRF